MCFCGQVGSDLGKVSLDRHQSLAQRTRTCAISSHLVDAQMLIRKYGKCLFLDK